MTKTIVASNDPKNAENMVYQGGYPVTIINLADEEPPMHDDDTAISASLQETPEPMDESTSIEPFPSEITNMPDEDMDDDMDDDEDIYEDDMDADENDAEYQDTVGY